MHEPMIHRLSPAPGSPLPFAPALDPRLWDRVRDDFERLVGAPILIGTPMTLGESTPGRSSPGIAIDLDAPQADPDRLAAANRLLDALIEEQATTMNLTQHVAWLWRELNFILSAERDLAAPLDVPTAARTLLDSIVATVRVSRGSIYEARGGVLEPVAAVGVPATLLVPLAIDDPASIAAWVYRHGAPLVVNDLSRRPPALRAHRFSLPAADHDAFLALPLLLPDAERTPVGVIQLAGKTGGYFGAGDVKLAAAAAQMTAVAIQRSRLTAEAMAAARLREELRLAAEIHEELLPRQAPALPGLRIAALTRPAGLLNGDYYDFAVGKDWLDFLVADVQGHGLGAALLVATVRAALRPALRAGLSPGAALARLNHVLIEATGESGIFVTAAVARLRAGRVTFASAGHPPLLLAADGQARRIDASGPPAGVVPGACYAESETVIGPQTTLALLSDGVLGGGGIETVSRLLETLAAQARSAPAAIAEALLHAISGPEDDRTVVVIQRDEGGPSR